MNATGSGSSALSLLAALGQTQGDSLSGLPGSAADGQFSSLITGLMADGGTATSGSATAATATSLLQNLPLTDQALPLQTALSAADSGTDSLLQPLVADGGDIETVLQQIRQGEQPLTLTAVTVTEGDESAVTDETATDDLTPDSDGAAVLFADLSAPATTAAASAPVAAERMTRVTGRPLDGNDSPLSDAETEQLTDSAVVDGTDVSAAEGEDFFLPESRTLAVQQGSAQQQTTGLSNAQPAQTATAMAMAAGSQTTVDDAASAADMTMVESTAEEIHTEVEQELAGLKEKLHFGQDRKEWGGALGARIVTMVADEVQNARIQLDPPELGSLEIKLQVSQDQATVQVQAQHAHVREVLESNAHRLRDALAGQGITLDSFDVSEQGSSGAGAGQSDADGNGGESLAGDEGWLTEDGEELAENVNRPSTASVSLLDTFA